MHGTDRPRCRWAPEGPEDTAAVPVGGGRARQRCPWAAAGPGRSAGERWRGLAGQRGDAPSEARGADGERAGSRPPAHTAARPHNPAQQAPRTPAAPINTTTGTARTRPGTQKTDTRYRMSACGGARGIRTPDLLIANETRYQLRHSPKCGPILASPPGVLASSVAVSPPTATGAVRRRAAGARRYSPAARRPSRMASRSMGWKSSSSSSTGAGM